jgi:hypothetical protein
MATINYKPYNSAFTTDVNTGDITGVIGEQGQVQFFPRVLAASGIPVMVANSGTIATNGTVTLGTALPSAYGAAFCYFPASAVSGDSTGGIYYVVFSSTTVGVVYAGKYGVANGVGSVAFTPVIPSGTLTAVTGSNSAYTGSTTETTLINVTVPAGSIGDNGQVIVIANWATNDSAGAKTGTTYLGGSSVGSAVSYTTSTGGSITNSIRNRGSLTAQISQVIGGAAAAGSVYTAINTAASTSITITGDLATATDNVILEGFTVELLPQD